ncbi:MAG: hypothetical protein JST86_17980 [Bacteroidetes bacterium]|nr:hypothetical protein [Bacteroidota bacterium]
MALEEFEKEQLNNREKNALLMRRITNYTMGVFFIAMGFFFMFPTRLTARFVNQYDPTIIKIFAVICWLYGVFRLYRGYSKNFYRN